MVPHYYRHLGTTDGPVGLLAGIHQQTPLIPSFQSHSHSSDPKPQSCLREGDCFSIREERYSSPSVWNNHRLHLNILSSTKEEWGMATDYQPTTTQPLHQASTLSDGNTFHSPSVPDCRLVGSIHRPEGRVSTRSYPQRSQTVPPIRLQGDSLPVPLSTLRPFHSPRVFTRITKVIAAFLRQKQVHLFMYLDNWLIVGPTRQDTIQALHQTVQLTLGLGFIINVEKSSLTPSQQPTYLGAIINLAVGLATPTLDRYQALRDCIQTFMISPSLPARIWLRLLGMMASLIDLVPWCRMHMRPLQLHLLYHFRPRKDPISKDIPVTQLIRDQLQWWLTRDNLMSGTTFPRPSPSISVTTDASKMGWGAHLEDQSIAGSWSTQQSQLHINHLELLAVAQALRSFQSRVRNQLVRVRTDNSTVVSYINRQGGTHSPSLCLATWELLQWCIPRGISLVATHLAGKKNSLADALSRGKIVPTEWSLHPSVVKHVFNLLGMPHVDLFASHLNHQLPTFCSRHSHPKAWKVDALSFDWTGIQAYAFPPISLVHLVLTKVERELSRILLVAPFWPRQPWFPRLLDLLVQPPVRLPIRPDLLTQPRTQFRHPDPASLHLCAWMLSKSPSDQLAFRKKLQPWQPKAGGNQLDELKITDSSISPGGARRELLIPFLHL